MELKAPIQFLKKNYQLGITNHFEVVKWTKQTESMEPRRKTQTIQQADIVPYDKLSTVHHSTLLGHG